MNDLAILIPVFRNQAGLERSLQSLREARGDFDVVIVDDGSPEPISAPRGLRETVAVELLRLERNQGIAAALNQGLRHILALDYTYVGRLDAGDTVHPDRFERQIQFLASNPRCGVVASFVDFVDSNRRPLFRYVAPCDHAKIQRKLHLTNCIIHPASTFRSQTLKEIGLYKDVPLTEDYELFLRMVRRCEIAVIPMPLTQYEYSLSGLSVSGRPRQLRERLKLQLRYFDPACLYSFLGVAWTLLAMALPNAAVLRLKRALWRAAS